MRSIFERIVLPVFGVMGTLITLITFVLPTYANAKVSLPLYVVTILFFLLAISVLLKVAMDLRSASAIRTFNNFRIHPMQFIADEDLFIIDRSVPLPLNASATIYVKDGLYEKPIALGQVSHVQEELIQIKVFAVLKKSLEIQSIDLKSIVIRPTSYANEIIQLVSGGTGK